MARPKDTDYTGTLTMLHTAVMNTGTDLRDAIGKGIEKLEASGQAVQQETTRNVVDELSRMRTNLREARDRLTSGGEMLNTEVRQAVTDLRTEMRQVRDAVKALTPPPAPSAPVPFITGNGSAPTAHEISQTEPAGPFTTPAGPDPVAQEAAEQPVVTATIPAQQDNNSGHHDGREGAAGSAVSAEEIRRAVREVLAEEFKSLRTMWEEQSLAPLAGVRDDVRKQLGEAVGVLREELEAARKESSTELAALREEAAKWRAEAEQRAAVEPAVVKVPEEHSALLREAARVSSATVLCYRDAWEFITAHAGQQPHFRVPAQVLDKGEERVRAALSGRSLIALLIALHSVRETAAEGDGDQELATALYERIQQSLTGLSAAGHPVTITLDDRITPDDGTPPTEHGLLAERLADAAGDPQAAPGDQTSGENENADGDEKQ